MYIFLEENFEYKRFYPIQNAYISLLIKSKSELWTESFLDFQWELQFYKFIKSIKKKLVVICDQETTKI